jgi:phage terminase large subunit GpA-like protein
MFFDTIAEIFTVREYRHPWQWAEDNVWVDKTSAFPGRYRSSTAPWTKELMEVFADNEVREVSVMCSAQSGKTQALMVLLAWAIAEDPGPAMWVLAAQDEAEDFMQTRLLPTLMECPSIRRMMPRERSGKRKGTIDFASMPLMVRGAGSPSKLQSVPIRWLILDEVRNYPAGALELVKKRVRAQWNSKIVQISTPDRENDAVHQAFLDGDQRKFLWKCVRCSEPWSPKWEDFEWEESDRTRTPEGKWLFEPLAETIRLKCPSCGHGHTDDPVTRRQLVESGEWSAQNAIAPRHKVSFTWSSIVPPWVRWRDIVEEFLISKKQLDYGNPIPMQTWKAETMGEPWVDSLKEKMVDFLTAMQGSDYELKQTTGGRVFLTADVQMVGVWFVVREWFIGGDSRLIDFGQVNEIDDLATIAERYNVNGSDVLIDSGFNTQAVYAAVIKHGGRWKATKGHDSTGYMVNNVRQPFMWSRVDAMVGRGEKKHLMLIVFSNPLLKDALAHLMSGAGPKWEFSRKAGDLYLAQVTAERREERTDGRGAVSYVWRRIRKDNHLFDCEVLQLLAALATKTLGSSAVTVDEGAKE